MPPRVVRQGLIAVAERRRRLPPPGEWARQKTCTFSDIAFMPVMPEVGTLKACGDDGRCRINPHIPHIGTILGVEQARERTGAEQLPACIPTLPDIACNLHEAGKQG
jgi:hypothetical protein